MKSINFKTVALVTLWTGSLLLVAQLGHGQAAQKPIVDLMPGKMISGDDIGFRFQNFSINPGGSIAVTGQWMVKVNGNWTSVQTPPVSVKPLIAN